MTEPLKASEIVQRHEALKQRQQAANERLIRLKADHASAQHQLEEERAAARNELGTDDIEAIRALYQEGLQNNTRIVLDGEAALDALEASLDAIEKQRDVALGKLSS